MKHLFFSLLCCLTLLAAFIPAQAQNNPVAMLEHAGSIKSYDGVNSFRNAYADAVEGDVIVLSAGNFLAPDTINKKHVNIRGNGGRQHAAEDNPTNPTIVSEGKSGMDINFDVDSIYVEGVAFVNKVYNFARNSSFVKCIFANTYYTSSSNYSVYNQYCTFINCRFSYFYERGNNSSLITGNNYFNCIIDQFEYFNTYGSGNFYNCTFGDGAVTRNSKTFYDNCIFVGSYSNTQFSANQCRYCLLLNSSSASNFFDKSYSNTNKEINMNMSNAPWSSYFKDFSGSNNKVPTEYILTDSIAGVYRGLDGTQIGVHGGNYPFDYEVSASHVVFMNVKPNVDNGKLSVTVKMSTDARDEDDDEE